MKKILALALALVLSLSLAACGGNPPAASAGSGAAASGSGSASGSGAQTDAKGLKIGMICDSSISDGGWGAACYNAMVDAAAQLNWETDVMDSIAQSDYVSAITSYCDLGYDMVFLPGNQYTDATKQVAKDYPDVCFALLNGTAADASDNIMSILPNADEIGWMAGVLAGLMTESKTLGFIGAMEIDTTKAKLAGFEAAAQVIDPEIKVLSAYSGDFADTAKGMELASGMIDKGADVFFGDASAVDSGARQAVDKANEASGSITVYDIGQPADLVALNQNPCLISSVVTDNAGMLKLAMEAAMNGTFGNDVIEGNLENGCLTVGQFNDELVPSDVQASYLGYVEQMKSGAFALSK